MFRLEALHLKSSTNYVFWLLIAILSVRVLGMVFYPLHEPTEARYAEIARKMLETQQWIMPQFDYGVPFWGKPPLSFWLTASSFELFGINEFAARLPSLLLACLMLCLVYFSVIKIRGKTEALISVMILASTALFFIAGGAVITDTALVASVTISMLGFWLAMEKDFKQSGLWGYLFFIGLGFGLLAKGPLVLILVFLPIVSWVALQKKWRLFWQILPWKYGISIMLLISLPWYVLAEMTSPGFFDYFIVGEHFNRFLDSGWQGDLYGSAHAQPRGKIWLLWIYACFPWSLVFLYILAVRIYWRDKPFAVFLFKNPWMLYLFLWTITPMVFFSFSGNILYTYVLSGLPAFAILMAELYSYFSKQTDEKKTRWIFIAYIAPVFGIVFLLVTALGLKDEKSQKPLIKTYHSKQIASNSRLIYLFDKPFAADFYTNGSAKLMNPVDNDFSKALNDTIEDFYILRNDWIQRLPEQQLSLLKPVSSWRNYVLLRDKGQASGFLYRQ